jgi:hypothetical protein
MIMDSAVTLTGSMNWTRGAAVNSEDLNLISSPAVAAAYAGHWRDRLAASVPFNRREDWCRAGSVTQWLWRRVGCHHVALLTPEFLLRSASAAPDAILEVEHLGLSAQPESEGTSRRIDQMAPADRVNR